MMKIFNDDSAHEEESQKQYLTREEILQVNDIPTEDVHVPEWNGGWVCVKGLTGSEYNRFQASTLDKKQRLNLINVHAKLVSLTVVDPQTLQPLFNQSDVVTLGKKSAIALSRVFTVAQQLSGITSEDIEELEGNLSSAPNGASISDWH